MGVVQTHEHDVVVVGARCAGAATARLLAARGHDVLVLDRGDLTADPLSTHGLARGGVVQLARWGLLDQVLASGASASRSVTFGVAGQERTRPVKNRAGVDLLVAPRRTVLDRILLDAARAAGAEVRLGADVRGVFRGADGRVAGVRATVGGGRGRRNAREVVIPARHVIGADGLHSRMAGYLGARELASFSTDVATYYCYVDAVPWTGYEMHVGEAAYGGVFPTHEGQAAVWLCQPRSRARDIAQAGAGRPEAFLSALAHHAPGLGARLTHGRVVSRVRGIVAPPNYRRQAYGDGWSLVGDAGYHRDPMTGHGITDAFRDAELLAEAVHTALTDPADESLHLDRWQRRRDAAAADVFRITRDVSRFPVPDRFVELQVELAEALDREAQMLASLPAPAGLTARPASA